MLEIVPPGFHIDILGKAKLGMALSIVVILTGLSTMVWRGGLKQGIDFSGGTLLQLRLSQPAGLGIVREALETVGWERAIVQHYGDTHEVLIRITQRTSEGQDIGAQVQRALQEHLPGQTIDIRRLETVGAQVSTELSHQAAFALLYAMLGMTIYISGRFEAKWWPRSG